MAIRFRAKRHHWEVYWRNPYTGKSQTATFAGKADAEKHDAFIKYKLKYEKEYFQPKEEAKGEDNTLEAIDYLYLKEKQFSEKGLAWHLDGMKKPLEMMGRKRIDTITVQDLSVVLAAQLRKNVKPVTVRHRMKTLYTLLRWAKRRGFIKLLPEFPELPEGHYKPIEIPTMEEVRSLLMVAPSHLKRVILIAANTGVRVGPSELFKLRWDDIDLNRGVIRVRAARKNPKEPVREVPIREDMKDMFKAWQKEDEIACTPWLISFCGKPVKSIKTTWTNCLNKAGIKRDITPYCLRHLFATEAIANGADVGTVSKLMGHASPEMVLTHYQHVLTKQKKSAVEALPSLINMPPLYGQACMGKKNGSLLQ